MLRQATDADFNNPSRRILKKLEIYFDGIGQLPLEITRDNYLVGSELLEESGADATWPLGTVSSNILTFQLLNRDGIFSPTNPDSIYKDKIKKGLVIKPYFKPDDEEVEEWIPMGEFYVSNWVASITGTTVNVTAKDELQDFFNAENLELKIERDNTYKEFYKRIFETYGTTVNVSSFFDRVLPYAFMDNSNSELLRQVTDATFGICISDRQGDISVTHPSETTTIRAEITDKNQIFEVDANQDVAKDYDGVSLNYNTPQPSSEIKLLEVKDVRVDPGINAINPVRFTQPNVMLITNVKVTSNHNVKVVNYNSTTSNISIILLNETNDNANVTLEVYGVALEHVENIIKDETEGNMLEVKNNFIQTAEQAAQYKQILNSFIDDPMPELKLKVRGNPLLKIGDKVRVISERYKLDYTGIIKRSILRYDGGLEGELTILNIDVLGGD